MHNYDKAKQYSSEASGLGDQEAKKNENREEQAGWLSRLLFWYLNPLLQKGASTPLTDADVGPIYSKDSSDAAYEVFKDTWAEEVKIHQNLQKSTKELDGDASLDDATKTKELKKIPKPSIIRAIRTSVASDWWKSVLAYTLFSTLAFAPPVLLRLLVSYLEGHQSFTETEAYGLGLLMFVTKMLSGVVVAWHNQYCLHVGFRARAAVAAAIYKKSTVLSSTTHLQTSVGNIVNLMGTDSQKLQEVTVMINMIWSAPLIIIFAMWLLYNEVGASMFVGVGFMIVLFPINGIVFANVARLKRIALEHTDQRVKLTNEFLSGVRVVKMYAWDLALRGRIVREREAELTLIRRLAYLIAGGFLFTLLAAPVLMPILVFIAYTKTGHELDAATAFTTLALFTLIRFPFTFLPLALQQVVGAVVSLRRIEKFLLLDEVDRAHYHIEDGDTAADVKITDGSFRWGLSAKQSTEEKKQEDETEKAETEEEDFVFSLEDINLTVPKGKLYGIYGPVGSGKSSLVSAILGHMEHLSGDVHVRGSIGYCAQQPWIRNATLRDNVLFDVSKPVQQDKYDATLSASALKDDLEQFVDGDLTEIGEQGVTLSGGQKARVALARAVYNDFDVYLMDDPLSAVDAHVAEHIFQHVFCDMLAEKTRIVVMNQIQFLPKMDFIVIVDHGRIVEQGTYEELMAKKQHLFELVNTHGGHGHNDDEKKQQQDTEDIEEEETKQQGGDDDGGTDVPRKERAASLSTGSATSKHKQKQKQAPAARLMTEEERYVGEVDNEAYWYYLKAVGAVLFVASFVAFGIAQGARVGADFWLAEWTDDTVNGTARSNDYYIGIYLAWGFGCCFFILARALSIAEIRIRASRTIHMEALNRIIRAPIFFFDTTPKGRVLNRFSADINVIDFLLSGALAGLMGTFLMIAASLVGVVVASKGLFIPALIPILVFYYYIQKFFRRTSTEVQRIESINRSPILAHFAESLTGITTIRTFNAVDRFERKHRDYLDDNIKAGFLFRACSNWLRVRLDVVSASIAAVVAIIAVARSDIIPPGWAGLALTYSMELTGILQHSINMASQVESNAVSVERLRHYQNNVPQEKFEGEMDVPEDWPQHGHIEVRKLKVEYKKGEPVLKSISFDVAPNEKVGICGRTGSGKSTFMLTLLRLVEASGGQILIDGVDVSKVALDVLRSRIGIIPQDPVLFSTSVRHNLDPFDEHTSEEIWHALELVQMKEEVEQYSEGLDYLVTEDGKNFSMGQRQSLCIARALLRRPKVLMLDEASSNIDVATDHALQRMIREQFQDCTVMTIAHRLKTIMTSNKILVLDQGNIIEYRAPRELLDDETSLLSAMVGAHGKTYARKLYSLTSPTAALDDEDLILNEDLVLDH